MKKKLAIILGIIIVILLIIPLIIYPLLFQGFSLENFQEVMEVKLGDSFKFNYGNICYKSFFKCHKVSLDTKGMVNTSVLGEYPIYYTFTYQNQTLKKKQIVKVVEDEPPVLTILEDNLIICPSQKEIKFKVSAYDNYDKDLTAKVIQYQEGNKMHFEVTDSSGNKTALVKDLIIKDSAPSLKLIGNSETYVKLNDAYNELGATAYDDCDGDLTAKIAISGKVDTSKVGEYLLTYKVTDSSQNTQSITRKVYVFDGNNTPSNKTIYLTFDDGPSAYTAQLLDVLKKYNIKATFFVTNPKGYDAIIKREYDEGHTIGLHSDTHDYSKIYQNPESYFNDLYTIQNKVKEITGYTSKIIRFPGGSSNTVSRSYDQGTKIMTLLAKEVEEKGFHYFDWNISSGDAGLTTSTSEVIYNIVSNLGNKEMYVVLQHDTKSYSVAAVEEVIKYGLAHGYNFKPLTMDTPVIHHRIAN